MPEAEMQLLESIEQMAHRPEDISLAARRQKDLHEKRLKMLFGPEAKDKFERESKGLDEDTTLEKDYETVNEGDTTDTTEAFDNESLLARKGKDDNVVKEEKKAKKAVEEGIKSSSDGEDEGEEAAAAETQEVETRKMTFTEDFMEEEKDKV